jgi:hypothetical protein
VVTLSRDGWVWAWHGHGKADQKIEWEGYHHDARNTGNYDVNLPVRAGPKPKKGCQCGESGPETILQLLAALTMGTRMRRRKA